MSSLISVIVVTVSVFGGFAMAHGPFEVLVQPAEYVIILGAAIGGMLGSAPLPVFFTICKTIPKAFKGSGINKATYYEMMGLLLTIFNVIRKEGVLGIEKDLANPHESERFKRYPTIAGNHHAMDLLVGSLRLFVDGVVNAFDLDKLMETEIDTHHKEVDVIPTLIGQMADALPGLGIVAAVLGVIITMQHIDGPPSEIGHHVAAALVGTFIGILASYGYFQPLAAQIKAMNHDTHVLLNSIRAGVVSFAGGSPPAVALEFARKSIESGHRPSEEEMEEIQKEARAAAKG